MMIALVLFAGLAPVASAAPSALAMDAPPVPLDAVATVRVDVTLTVHDFLCHEPYTLGVALETSPSEGVQASVDLSSIAFDVPARSYFVDTYEETRSVNLSVNAGREGEVALLATFAQVDEGPCFVPGGFEPSRAFVRVLVTAPDAPPPTTPPETDAPPADPPTTEPPAADPPADDAPAADEPAVDAPASDAPPAPRPSGRLCGPDATCAPVGNYDAPAESEENATPGVTWLAMLAVLGIAALVARRRR